MGRAVAESKRADELRRKAASVGTAGISSEDPEAGEKIADKVARLEAKQARMKAANAAIRKHRKAGPTAQIAALVELGFGQSAATALIEPDCCGRFGFPDYALQNNNANIRRPKARNPRVEAIQNADEMQEQFGDIEYREQDGRVWLEFPGKQAEDVRATLRPRGFRGRPTRGAGVGRLSEHLRNNGRHIPPGGE